MSELITEPPRRLHPITPVFDLIANARQIVLPAGAAAVAGEWWLALPILVFAVVMTVRWLTFTYQLDGNVVRTTQGLFVRKRRTIALDRIQQVDIVSKLRHRVIGVVGLHVDTASGGSGAELQLDVVSTREAERLRRVFEAGVGQRTDTAEVAEPRTTPPAVSVSLGQLALAGMTGAQTLVILSIVFSLQELAGVIDFGRLRTLVPEGAESDPIAITVGFVSAGATWLGLAALAQILTHYDYKAVVTDAEFHITRGLLDRREVGGALRRVQAVRVEQTLVRRVLGFAAVRVQTAAIPGQQVSRIVIPYVATADVERVVRVFLPGLDEWPVLPRTPRAALTLALVRRVPPTVAAAAIVAALFWPWGALALLAIPLAVCAAFLHWTAHGFATAGATVWARQGGLFRETVVIPGAKTQSLRLAMSPLQRRYGLSSLHVDVAGSGSTPRIQDAPADDLDAVVATVLAAAPADERVTRASRT